MSCSCQSSVISKIAEGMPIMQTINEDVNRIGPSIDPWGTLLVTGPHLDFVQLITTLRAQPFIQSPIHLTVCSSNMNVSSLSVRILWETVPKALLKAK